MKIAISGSTGLVGSCLREYFTAKGDEVISLVRSQSAEDKKSISWHPEKGILNPNQLEGMDVIIHLGGANIAAKRWSEEYKQEILNSRVGSTQLLAGAIAQLKNAPKVFICASAVGIYGPQLPHINLDERSPLGHDFLADVCKKWEYLAQLASRTTRVVNLRFGVILSRKGGALKKMLLPFQWGLGGKLGTGEQMMSWISLLEIPHIVDFVATSDISGPVNCVTPYPISNLEFTKTMGQVLKRPTVFPVPEGAVKLLFGEMGDTLLLKGAKAVPTKLLEAGYKFYYPKLKNALEIIFTV